VRPPFSEKARQAAVAPFTAMARRRSKVWQVCRRSIDSAVGAILGLDEGVAAGIG
jgi:hypothetical protein